jgi:TadE-like protein
MWKLLRNNRGSSAVEFALVALPVLTFILGIIQTGWLVWANNLLHLSVDAAARCGAVNSTTSPCKGSSNMIGTANLVFGPLSSATFGNNTSCGGTGLIGTYKVTIVFVVDLTLTAKSCYPTVPTPS